MGSHRLLAMLINKQTQNNEDIRREVGEGK